MGESGLSVNLGDCLPYLEQRILQIFGKDEASKETADWFTSLQKTALKQASQVYCVGMDCPLPFHVIYQPTRIRVRRGAIESQGGESFAHNDKLSRSILRAKALEESTIGVDEFLNSQGDAIIYAGPGWGKTTFLHHLFRRLLQSPDTSRSS
jgi:hypothetical protein